MMHFFDLNGLTQHLKEQKNTEFESYQYMLGCIILSNIPFKAFVEQKAEQPSQVGILVAIIASLVMIGISYLVLRSFYRSNGEMNGRFFLHRLLSLTWVLGTWFMVLFLPLAAAVVIFQTQIYLVFVLLAALLLWAIYYVVTINRKLQEIHTGDLSAASSIDGR